MFKPLSMRYISLKILTEDAAPIAQLLADCGMFNPEITEQLSEQPGETYRSLFNQAQNRLHKIMTCVSLTMPKIIPSQPAKIEKLQETNEQLADLWLQISELEEQLHQLSEQESILKRLLETLAIFQNLDVDLALFQDSTKFLNLHIGTVPVENIEQLREAISLAEHLIDVFHHNEDIAYFVVAGPLTQQDKVKAILEHADFQTLAIPEQFHAHPQQVHNDLINKQKQLAQEIESIKNSIQKLASENKIVLEQAYQTLNNAAAYAKLSETLRGQGRVALIEGWIPKTDVAKLEASLNEKLECPFVFSSRKPIPSEYQKVPSLTRHHPYLAPFAALVNNYGTPRYGEFDPTLLFTVTFIFMFGSMFGDVGHGALIAGAGWYWRSKFTPFFLTTGISSIIFGFLYGSIFGFEEVILPALWLSPIHNPNVMLEIALYWGCGFVLLATMITVVNRWREGNYAAALFNHTGIAGICLYIGGFFAIKQWMETDVFATNQQLAIVVPLLIILGYKWYENKMPLAERILVTLIEGLESVINYLANTLSFLRVAAFSLNHAALAIAVFTLADMMDFPASWLVIVLGNLFIVGLEGAIVTIQVLRLEYYEGFSRFFSGDGKEFKPLTPYIK
ncbi:V-type ATPase 116kDa subunit family protein [Candidatus Halobeggiatoa sp. HSG11]|nr:V-type ATPase 116kDa subunit family protein [Candidatus Halobeggiatoa sp. HSG11]